MPDASIRQSFSVLAFVLTVPAFVWLAAGIARAKTASIVLAVSRICLAPLCGAVYQHGPPAPDDNYRRYGGRTQTPIGWKLGSEGSQAHIATRQPLEMQVIRLGCSDLPTGMEFCLGTRHEGRLSPRPSAKASSRRARRTSLWGAERFTLRRSLAKPRSARMPIVRGLVIDWPLARQSAPQAELPRTRALMLEP